MEPLDGDYVVKQHLPEVGSTIETVANIKWFAYSVVAYIIVSVGIIGNLLNLVVLTRPNLKGVMYVYLLALAVSNLCVLISAIPALFDISSGLTGGDYTTAFYQAHLELPLINSFMASSVYIIIFMTVNRYISIYKPTDFQRLHTFKNAKISIFVSFLWGIILHIPLCFQNKVTNSCFNISTNLTTSPNTSSNTRNHDCVWSSDENFIVSSSLTFKAYLVLSEILLRFGPIMILAILNILIIHKFLKIAKKRMIRKGYSTKGERSYPSPPSSPHLSANISSSTNTSSTTQSSNFSGPVSFKGHLAVPCHAPLSRCISPITFSHCGPAPLPRTPSPSQEPCINSSLTPHRHPSRRKSLQNPEERMLVLVLIAIVILFVICATPAAILSILYSVKLDDHIEFQIFRAVANNLELLNFALNFYIYCMCSAEIRRAFVSVFGSMCRLCRLCNCRRTPAPRPRICVKVEHV